MLIITTVGCETRCNCSDVTVWNDGYIERYDYLTDWCDTETQYSTIGRDYITITTCY